MGKNLKINDTIYNGVESLSIPTGDGGMATFIDEENAGAKLPEMTNPAGAGDIVLGKEAVDAEGNLLIGTINHYDPEVYHTIGMGTLEVEMVKDEYGDTISTATISVDNELLLHAGQNMKFNVPAGQFGNATEEDVAAGKTFTSRNGRMLTGTAAGGSADYSAVTFNKVRVVVTDKAVGVLAVAYVDAENGGNIQTWTQVVGGATVNTIYNLPVNAIYSSAQVIGADYATPIPVYIGNGNGTLTLTTDRDVFLGNK